MKDMSEKRYDIVYEKMEISLIVDKLHRVLKPEVILLSCLKKSMQKFPLRMQATEKFRYIGKRFHVNSGGDIL